MGLNDASGIPKIMVFRPTIEEMADFSKYLEYMESQGANKAGLAKIIPPPEWCPRQASYDEDDVLDRVIKAPIQQLVEGSQGLYQQYNIQKKSMTVREFKKLSESTKYRTPKYFDYEDLERKYWKNVSYNAPIYGADVPGSIYDEHVKEFNINHLDTILDLVSDSYGIKILGVNTAYLYFGMWKTTFAWHTEDMDLYSINYLHFGAPKSWYTVPPCHGRRLERLAAGFFPNSSKSCPAFLRHKMTLISPHVLKQYSIPYNKITQEPGEFMITFPFAYHAGYNHGYNCAESTNFALPRWVEYGKRATRCSCRSDSVKISMETFVKKFQPDRYDAWLIGKDIGPHPEDPSHISAAPLPSEYELNVLSKVSKSKRHPPFRKDLLAESDEDDYNEEDCQPEVTVPTKGAKKLFEPSDYNEEPQPVATAFIEPNPPTLDEGLESLRECLTAKHKHKKKRKKYSLEPTPLNSVANALPKGGYCTKPSLPFNTLTWPTISITSITPDVHSLVDNFIDIAKQQQLQQRQQSSSSSSSSTFIAPSTSSDWNTNKSELNLIKNDHDDLCPNQFPPPPPPLLRSSHSPPPPPLLTSLSPSKYHLYDTSSFSYNNISFDSSLPDNSLECFPPPPLLSKHQSSDELVENKLINSIAVYNNNDNKNETLPLMNSFNGFNVCENFMDSAGIQTTPVEVSVKKEAVDSCTSTDDLLVNEIIVNSRTVQSSELIESVCNRTNNSDLNQLLKCVPIPLHLYQYLPYNYFGEQLYNASIATIYPHCSICIMLRKFKPRKDWFEAQASIPKSSPVLIPSSAFAFKVIDQTTTVSELSTSPLLICSDCKICVHTVCYGIVNNTLDGSEKNWKCDRCLQKKYGVHCCLCPLRGGALKQTETPNVWVHLTCALMQPLARFTNGLTKSPVEISGVKKTRGIMQLKCSYCQKSNNRLADYITGFCIQCFKAPKCSAAFHVTCAHIAGAVFETNDWPYPIRVYCNKCITNSEVKRKSSLSDDSKQEIEIEVNTMVIAKHKNNRYYKARIIESNAQIFHHVHFDDNSFYDYIKSTDFTSHEINDEGDIEIGDDVKVLWNKDILKGKYSGSHKVFLYKLLFEDASKTKAKREEFFLDGETLPKKVEAKLSEATDQKHHTLFSRNAKKEKLLND